MSDQETAVTLIPEQKALATSEVAGVSPMALLQVAVQNGGNIDLIEKLMDLQERAEARGAKKEFDKALADFKANPPKITKDSKVRYKNAKNQVVEYDHATLAGIIDVVGECLAPHGLSATWRTSQTNGQITVTCILSHSMGHSEETSLSAGSDSSGGKNSIQAIGSTVSYLQRYTFLAITGLAAHGMDDDGKTGGDSADSQKGQTTNNQRQSQNQPKQQTQQNGQQNTHQTKNAEDPQIKAAVQQWINIIHSFEKGKHNLQQFQGWFAENEGKLTDFPKPQYNAILNAKRDKETELSDNGGNHE